MEIERKFQIRGHRFFFTFSQCDCTNEEILELLVQKFKIIGVDVKDYIVCREHHEDGNLHLHAYVRLDHEVRASIYGSHFDYKGFHPRFEVVRNPDGCKVYCQKEGDFITNLKNLSTVKSLTKEEIAKQLLAGEKLTEVVKKAPKYLFGYARLKVDLSQYLIDSTERKHRDGPVGIWISGPAGCGKSTIAQTRMGPVYIKDNNRWFDGYSGESTIVCEDVDKSWRDVFPKFKIWADRYDFTAEIKGSTIGVRCLKFVVTSNRTLEELLLEMSWPDNDYAPYLRRFRQYRITSIEDWEEQL